MSTAAAAPARTTPMPAAYAAGGLAAAAVVIFAGNYNLPKGENGGTGPAIVTGILCAVLTAALFGLLVPRAQRLERTTLVLGVLSVLSLVVFWSGITAVLAATTFAVAARGSGLGRRASVGQGLAAGAVLLAVGWTLANSHVL